VTLLLLAALTVSGDTAGYSGLETILMNDGSWVGLLSSCFSMCGTTEVPTIRVTLHSSNIDFFGISSHSTFALYHIKQPRMDRTPTSAQLLFAARYGKNCMTFAVR
jgi:hypothetical protein